MNLTWHILKSTLAYMSLPWHPEPTLAYWAYSGIKWAYPGIPNLLWHTEPTLAYWAYLGIQSLLWHTRAYTSTSKPILAYQRLLSISEPLTFRWSCIIPLSCTVTLIYNTLYPLYPAYPWHIRAYIGIPMATLAYPRLHWHTRGYPGIPRLSWHTQCYSAYHSPLTFTWSCIIPLSRTVTPHYVAIFTVTLPYQSVPRQTADSDLCFIPSLLVCHTCVGNS